VLTDDLAGQVGQAWVRAQRPERAHQAQRARWARRGCRAYWQGRPLTSAKHLRGRRWTPCWGACRRRRGARDAGASPRLRSRSPGRRSMCAAARISSPGARA